MSAWPDVEELAQVVNVDNVEDWIVTLDRTLTSAIDIVKADVGLWDDYVDEPDDRLAQAALRMGELLSQRPGVATDELRRDPTYHRLMFGHRRVFGVA